MNIDGYALVIGAASGIGLACAQQYAEEGAAGVAFADLNLQAAEAASRESLSIASHTDYRAIAIHVDVVDEKSVEEAVARTSREFGRIDYAVNCAGLAPEKSKEISDFTSEEWDRLMNVNLLGMFHCVKAEINAMKKQEARQVSRREPKRGLTRGVIVNLGSISSHRSFIGNSSYGASKHGVLGLTRTAARDSIGHHIRINCVCPWFVDTPLLGPWFERVPDARKACEELSPMKRLALPVEVADVVMFHSSPRSSFVVGSDMIVGGAIAI